MFEYRAEDLPNADELRLDGTAMHAYNTECDKGEIILKPWYFTRLNDLVGTSFVRVHRTCDLICLDFAIEHEEPPAYALHVQALARFFVAGNLICSANTFLESESRM